MRIAGVEELLRQMFIVESLCSGLARSAEETDLRLNTDLRQ
jgi:hypothetical protein